VRQELRILLVEDVPTDAELEVRELKRAGLRVAHRVVDTEDAYREALREFRPDVILSDFSMPHFDGMSALALARELVPDVPFIFVSGTIGEEYAIRALKNGATDYVLKNNLVRLPASVERALQDGEERAARRTAEEEVSRQRAFLRQVIDLDRNRIFAKDREGRFTLVNQAFAESYGCSVEDMLGKTNADFNPDREQAERFRKIDLEVMKTLREVFIPEEPITDATGKVRWIQTMKRPLISADGKANMVLGVATDITERKNQELKINRLNRVYAVLSGINTLIVRVRDRQQLFDEACRIAHEHGKFAMSWIGMLDEATQAITPVAKAGRDEGYLERLKLTIDPNVTSNLALAVEAVGRSAPVICNDIATDGRMRPWRAAALERGYRSTVTLPLLLEQRAVGIFELYSPEPGFFDEEEMKLLVELAGDIAFALQTIEQQGKLDYLSYYDPLTGLPNRTLFHDRVNQALQAQRESGGKAALLFLDLQRFGIVNDTYGRQTGDALLKLVAGRLESVLGSRDFLARIGADTFATVLRDVKQETDIAHTLEQGILNALRQPFEIGGVEIRMAAQAGIALFPGDGNDAETLFRNADAALNKAKDAGDVYLFYAPQMNARVAEQLKLENGLRNAIVNEQYVLHYQPRFDLANGQIVGMEALIRWMHPERGIVPPGEFIPLLEETGMILDVGRWALRRAALEHAAWCTKGRLPPRIAVNVSPAQLRRRDFVDHVKDALAPVDRAAERLDIEITESMLMDDIEGSIDKLKAVQSLGLQVALDDFGTGYSSLSYLARLPINSLKVDRSFITQMPKGPEQMAIVSAVISLARALNLKVVAEGVETEEQANLLRLLRCDEAQGYLFGRPVPPEEMERLLPLT